MPDTPPTLPTADRLNPARRALDGARRKLLETGTRNRLIHVNRANARANCLTVINEQADPVHDILRLQGRKMRFRAMGQDRSPAALQDGPGPNTDLAAPDPDPVSADRLTDGFLETPLGLEAQARRLLRLAGDARTAEEEQGVNILFLAIGFLRWFESPSSQVPREAPLILLPVQLIRNERSSTFDIQCRDDDLATNLPLAERLRQDFGINLPEIDEDEGWTPSDYFARVQDAIAARAGWSVDADGMQLGFFSFAKLLMHRDLSPDIWDGTGLDENPLLGGLLRDGFGAQQPIFAPGDRLDAVLDPAQIIQVVDADASQTKVIEEVRRGASLVVQGPPGTGKSQTITNIIAAAVHDGKSVLFVAEKMAALSVVHDRLVRVGLRDICLELHSRSANKRALAQELARTLMASAQALPGADDPAALRMARDDLNRIAELLHAPLPPTGDTPFDALAGIIGHLGMGAPPPVLPHAGLDLLDADARAQARAAIRTYVAARHRAGPPALHAFRGTGALDLQPTDLSRLEAELVAARGAMAALVQISAQIAAATGLDAPATLAQATALVSTLRTLAEAPPGAPPGGPAMAALLFAHIHQPRLQESLTAGADWARAQGAASARFAPQGWEADVIPLRPALVRGQASFWSRLFGGYRRASAQLAELLVIPLPKAPADRLALVDELAEVQRLRKALRDDEAWLQSVLGADWRGERTPFADLAGTADWLARLHRSGVITSAAQLEAARTGLPDPDAAAEGLEGVIADCSAALSLPIARLGLDVEQAGLGKDADSAPLAGLDAAFARMAADPAHYGDFAALARAVQWLARHSAAPLAEAVEAGRVDPARAEQDFDYACAEARWTAARTARPDLNRLQDRDRHDLVRLFRDLEQDRIDTARDLVLSRHFEQMPRGTAGEMGIIRGEIARKRGHKPIRWIMRHAGRMVQRIKPVMLMSPISVAQFLPPGSLDFDLLVIDEASQVRPEDALGAVARARQIVVVGDQQQLPPTSFFDRLVDDSADADPDAEDGDAAGAADMESILSLCEARGLRARMLEWHYRSRDPSLIRVSNAEFYDDRLVLPPSPLQLDPDYGLTFCRVAGVYARGGSGLGRQGTNRIEAEAVAAAVARHARNWPDLSLGVVAFSKVQADMLTDVLDLARRRDPVLDAFLREGRAEDVFVKNIENVQGDERDVILISVGYGPQEAGGRLPSISFGAINSEGGERRLNVLFSRARIRCEVFASFDPAEIDPARSRRQGPRVLKRFLTYAQTGVMDQHLPTGLGPDSPFEADVAGVIARAGYLADPQVGSAGFRIDIGVRHPDRPGQYLLAVECDGAAYHGALWARERDRLRQDILENLGWRFHRIWSTDWFHHRSREMDRLTDALARARDAAQAGLRLRGANHDTPAAAVPAGDASGDIGGDPAQAAPPPDAEALRIPHLDLTVPPYIRAAPTAPAAIDPHEAPLPLLADLIRQIVAIEGPVHLDEVARRITVAFGLARTGSRITDATRRALHWTRERDPALVQTGEFVMTQGQAAAPPVRDRSAETGALLRAGSLPPIEIAAAAALIRRDSGTIDPDDLTRAVARLLGFRRMGSDLAETIAQAISQAGATDGDRAAPPPRAGWPLAPPDGN